MNMDALISGTIAGASTAGVGIFTQAAAGPVTSESSGVTIAIAVGAAFIVYNITKEFTRLRDDVNTLLKDKEKRDEEDSD